MLSSTSVRTFWPRMLYTSIFTCDLVATLNWIVVAAENGFGRASARLNRKPLAIAGWSQMFAALAMAPFVPLAEPAAPLTPLIALNVFGLALFCSSIAYVLYYRLIADIGPTRALTMAFLMPVFGMLWGALFLGEPITLAMIAGCALIIAGATAVLRPAPASPSPSPSPRRL